MPLFNGQVTSYNNTAGQPRDLSKILTMIAPTDTPFMTRSGTGNKATQRKHEWTKDSLADPGANAQVEGADVTQFQGSEVIGLDNIVQRFEKAINVSGTAQAVEQVGVSNQYNHQMANRMKEIKKDVEYALLGNTVAEAGNTTTARVMRGLSAWITTNVDLGAGGAAATPTAAATPGTLRALTGEMIAMSMQKAYEEGGDPTILMCSPAVRRKVTKVLKIVNVQDENPRDKRVTDTVRIYDSDFGELLVVPNRVQAKVPYAANALFILDMEYWKKSYLRNFAEQKLAKTGDSEKGMITGELTMEARAEESSAMIADINPAL